MVRLLAERSDTKSNVKLGGFQSQLQVCLATLKSCDSTKQSVCGWQYIYIYIYIFKKKTKDWLINLTEY